MECCTGGLNSIIPQWSSALTILTHLSDIAGWRFLVHPLGGWQSVAIRARSLPRLQPHQRRNWLSWMEAPLGTRWRPHSDNLLTPALKNPPMRAQPTSWSIASCQKRVLLTGAAVSPVLCTLNENTGGWWWNGEGFMWGRPGFPRTGQNALIRLSSWVWSDQYSVFFFYIFRYKYILNLLYVFSCYTFPPFMWGCSWLWWSWLKKEVTD